jgi:photosystem II stability/assembly factor-like uncharacterized protein
MRFCSPHEGWALAYDGSILATLDGGRSWKSQAIAPLQERHLAPSTIAVLSHLDRLLLCSYLSREERCFISHDGGNSWRETWRFFSDRGTFLSSELAFADAEHGWLALAESRGSRRSSTTILYSTADGGNTWTRAPFRVSGSMPKILFADRLRGFLAVGTLDRSRNRYCSTIYLTADGGNRWQVSSEFNELVRDICVTANSELIACGQGGLLARTADNGKSWVRLKTGTRATLESLHLRGVIGIAAGNSSPIRSRRNVAILLSRDAGRTWRRTESPICASIVDVYLTGWDRGVIAAADAFYEFRLEH